MGKAAFRHMRPDQQDRIAQVAARMFADGFSATTVCERFGIPLATLMHICRLHRIDVPRQRRSKSP